MPAAELASFADLVVAHDYGQFCLQTAEEDSGLAVDLLDEALDAGIAQQGGLVVLTSPHQNNFEMPLRVEVWTGAPDSDLAEWEAAFQARLDVELDGLTFTSPTLDPTPLPVPPGSYRALITGRGFIASGWPGSVTPGDRWRVQVWPTRDAVPVRRLKQWTPSPNPQGREAGPRQAGRRKAKPSKRIFDMSDPTRRDLIAQTDRLLAPVATDYSHVHIDPLSETLDVATMFHMAPSQLRLVLTGPEIDSIDPHGYLRRIRSSIAEIVVHVPDRRAEPLVHLDGLIAGAIEFDATDQARATVLPN